MTKIVIIIPSRLDAQRLPNKPLKLIDNKEMILHVYEAATKSKAGEVYVATPDQKIIDIVKNFGGKAILTDKNHENGTDRVFEVFKKTLNCGPKIIVNLQGDMPNIIPKAIKDLVNYMKEGKCEIATLASKIGSNSEIEDKNVVKVLVKNKLKPGEFVKALDFVRINPIKNFQIYHHIGIYAFTDKALLRYVDLERSKLELDRKLEQMRAMENKMSVHVGYIDTLPLSVDTEKDLKEIKKVMEANNG
tara:strand:+ start:44 stop:784 length:741 start_codon:yes stop_codon:yes gene_type:complete